MLTVIFTCATSFAHYYGEKAIYENGNWHFFVKTDYESAKKYLLSDSSLKDIGFNRIYQPRSKAIRYIQIRLII